MLIPTVISLACTVIHKVLPEASDHSSSWTLFMLEWISFALILSLRALPCMKCFALVNITEPVLLVHT